MVTPERIRRVNDRPVAPGGDYVLYWMIAARRTTFNPALERAADLARALGRPLLILEALRLGYPHASDRLHRFILEGMADNRRRLRSRPVTHLPYVEPTAGAGRGLLAALAARACAVVTDDYPTFFLPRMVAAATDRVPVALEAVDGNGLLPMAAGGGKAWPAAVHFRAHLQKVLPDHLASGPVPDPLAAPLPPAPRIPREVAARWPAAADRLLAGEGLGALDLDHGVGPVAIRGGTTAARAALDAFVENCLQDYEDGMRHPDEEGTSGLSPWLHFGHLSAQAVFEAVASQEGWSLEALGPPARGARSGWWGMRTGAEAFLDQLVTWRELGFNFCHHREDAARFSGLPGWARATLGAHAGDPRPRLYDLDTLEAAATDDPVWNAAQRELKVRGRIHGQLRMLWGKRVLTWTRDPEEAFERLVHLNDRWAVDGRDPNSYSGIGWVFGRYDRPWSERTIFGRVRPMSSERTAKKLRMAGYLARYGPRERPPGGEPAGPVPPRRGGSGRAPRA